MRVLVAGWFSFEHMGATAGDLMARDVACRWLAEAGCPFDVAAVPPFATDKTVDWRAADPRRYTHVLFVCGPFGNGEPATGFLRHFAGRRLVGLDVTMLQPLDEWNPFDLLFERDSSRASHPDLAFVAPTRPARIPVVGIVLAHPQKEYKRAAMHAVADAALHRLTESREAARLHIDTCLDPWNTTGLRTAGEIEAIIASADVVLTTRLHGMVLALKNGVPALVIDPIAGGAKLRRQAETIGWPLVFTADTVTDEALQRAFDHCLTPAAREEARACAASAAGRLDEIRHTFVQQMRAENG
jgi:hypothetical protein